MFKNQCENAIKTKWIIISLPSQVFKTPTVRTHLYNVWLISENTQSNKQVIQKKERQKVYTKRNSASIYYY